MESLRTFLFGVAIAAPIGPVALLLVRVGLTRTLAFALTGALGVAAADFSYALVALSAGSGIGALLQRHRDLLHVTSSGLLLALGLWLCVGVARSRPADSVPENVPVSGSGFVQLYLLTLANPLTILLFVGFSGQMAAIGTSAAAVLRGAALLFLGSFAVQVSYASFGALLQRLIRHPAAVRALNGAGALAVAGFGAYGLWVS